jgi:hypothetical protein
MSDRQSSFSALRRSFLTLLGGAVVSTSPSYTFTVSGNLALTSNFVVASPPPPPSAGGIIPADRNFAWNPGMMSKGGIPNRTTICATLSPSGGDDTGAIQSKLDTCPADQVIALNAGTFTVNNYLLIHTPVTLRGAGAGKTILNKANGVKGRSSTIMSGTTGIMRPVDPGSYSFDTQPIIIVGQARWPRSDSTTAVALTGDGFQGANSVTVSNARGIAAGQFVLLDELSAASWQPTPTGFPGSAKVWQGDRVTWAMHLPVQQYQDDNGNSNAAGPYDSTPGTLPQAMSWFSRPDRPTCEIKEVASVSGNTVTFTSPLTITYRASHQAQLTRYTANGNGGNGGVHVARAGVENLTLMGGGDGELRFETAAYSWAKAVEVTQWLGEGIAVNNSFRVEIRDSYIHTGAWPEPGGGGYAISFANGSSEVLIENNISRDVNKVMVMRSSGAGSVVAYNYTDDGWIFTNPVWQEVGINASHMVGPHHVLFEGNYSFNADSDDTHGSSIYITFFRTGQSFNDVGGNPRAIGLNYGSWWDSFVGNVLGRPGQMTGWDYTDVAMSCDASGNNCTGNNATWHSHKGDIWELGVYQGYWRMNPDPKILQTVIRDGNYDYLTNSQRWHNTPVGFTIPDSMYLTSKPTFFGTNPWPWVNPATGVTKVLPAKARYDAGTPNG